MAEWADLVVKLAGVAGGVLAFLVGLFLWMARKEWVTRTDFAEWAKAHAESHADLDRRLDNGELRFTRIEGKIDHLATREDLALLSKSVSDVAASVHGLQVAVDNVGKSVEAVNRLTEMLIQKGS